MNEMAIIAPVRKTVSVKAPIEHAFEVFTSGLTRWWPHDHGVGKKPIQKVLMEPRLGGRWLEISQDGTETSVATIIVWEPPLRFVMLWQVNALLHHRFETMGAEAGASMRKDVDGGWPGLIERFVREAERSRN